ncbi:FecR domain-containing protein [Sphingobium sufflavum]|uniref:FecR family protein n=1 Tax=Sphingobium sufflavum TaxID=1129547 RepID=UPI001F2CA6C1|nr:FecR domain-containing protein [Sphingobium sufflavum]MCE7796430.1 FecR domain-containing protein [Sphingobium sufflavum]
MSIEEHDDPIETVEDQAADWIVRQDGDGLTVAEERAFAAWLDDPRHRTAYDRHRAIWARYQQAGTALASVSKISVFRPMRHHGRRRPALALAMAACMTLLLIGHACDWPTRWRADYATDVGERRTVRLEDGSRVQLDGRSAIAFERTAGQRVMRLLSGGAAIEVAPDAAHPFVVRTDAGRVTALGTAFVIRKTGASVDLVVTEHSVRVDSEKDRRIVREGEATRFHTGSVATPLPVDLTTATAWTRGKLIIFNQPLSEVVTALGGQRRGYWTVRGDAAAIRVNGVYDLDDPLAALGILERTLKLRSFRLSDRFVILSR